jgi:diguanylate cyclase (GGDEF)-like protein
LLLERPTEVGALEVPGPAGLADASREELLGYIQALERRALHDPLTSLPNRGLLEDRLHQAVALSQRRSSPLAVLLCDLDNFKEVNDRYGHDLGDVVLREVASRLVELLRASDSVGRLGGDEFVVLLPDTDRPGAEVVAGKISLALRRQRVEGVKVAVSMSVGISMFPDDGLDADALLRGADASMYGAKGRRRAALARRVRKVLGVAAALVLSAAFFSGGLASKLLVPGGHAGLPGLVQPKAAERPVPRGLLPSSLERRIADPEAAAPEFFSPDEGHGKPADAGPNGKTDK